MLPPNGQAAVPALLHFITPSPPLPCPQCVSTRRRSGSGWPQHAQRRRCGRWADFCVVLGHSGSGQMGRVATGLSYLFTLCGLAGPAERLPSGGKLNPPTPALLPPSPAPRRWAPTAGCWYPSAAARAAGTAWRARGSRWSRWAKGSRGWRRRPGGVRAGAEDVCEGVDGLIIGVGGSRRRRRHLASRRLG